MSGCKVHLVHLFTEVIMYSSQAPVDESFSLLRFFSIDRLYLFVIFHLLFTFYGANGMREPTLGQYPSSQWCWCSPTLPGRLNYFWRTNVLSNSWGKWTVKQAAPQPPRHTHTHTSHTRSYTRLCNNNNNIIQHFPLLLLFDANGNGRISE